MFFATKLEMKLFVLLILAVFASENGVENGSRSEKRIWQNNEKNPIVVKIEEDEYVKVNKKSKFIGVTFNKNNSNWRVRRLSRNQNTMVYNGCYIDEGTAAHASDTLARKLMENGEPNHKLNFPDNYIEVYPEKKSKYIGVTYNENSSKWRVQRRSRNENTMVSKGYYDDEETAAHASDTLARKLMENGEQNHRLNFPDDYIEFYPKEKSSKYIGVSYYERESKWNVRRWSKNENKNVHKGCYDNEETAAHASDTLARKLMENGELKLKLNFPDDHTEVYRQENQKKRKRPKKLILEHPQNN